MLTEAEGVFVFEQRMNLEDKTANIPFRLKDLEGTPVAAAVGPVKFLAAFKGPNMWRNSLWHAPVRKGPAAEIPDVVDAEAAKIIADIAKVLGLLNDLQQRTETVIAVPDLDKYVAPQLRDWLMATKLLAGEDVTVTVAHDYVFDILADRGTTAPEGSFGVYFPWPLP